MKFIKNIFFLAGCLLVLNSCERDAISIDLPEAEAQVVVECFLDPRFPETRVVLGRTNPLRPKNKIDNNYLMGAQVTINVDGVDYNLSLTSTIPGNNKFEYFNSSIPKNPGSVYKLSVKFADGKEITSQTSIPTQEINSNTIELSKKINPNAFGDSILQINASFLDLPGKSFYRIIGNSSNGEVYFTNSYFDDVNKEGQIVNSGLGELYFNSINDRNLTLYLIYSDEDYWKYHKSVEAQFNSGLFNEPTLVHTNINGGIGIFVGFRVLEYQTTF